MPQPFPHRYVVTSVVGPEPEIVLESPGVSPMRTALPSEFGGPGDRWSPETLFVAAVTDCYALTFRGIAAKSKLAWTSLLLTVTGVLDRADEVTRFTHLQVRADLIVPDCTNERLAARILEKADQTCLITRSLACVTSLRTSIICPDKKAPAA